MIKYNNKNIKNIVKNLEKFHIIHILKNLTYDIIYMEEIGNLI